MLGAGVLETAQQVLAYQLGGSQIYLVAYAGVFLLVMLVLPRGILPTVTDRLRQRRRRTSAAAASRSAAHGGITVPKGEAA